MENSTKTLEIYVIFDFPLKQLYIIGTLIVKMPSSAISDVHICVEAYNVA